MISPETAFAPDSTSPTRPLQHRFGPILNVTPCSLSSTSLQRASSAFMGVWHGSVYGRSRSICYFSWLQRSRLLPVYPWQLSCGLFWGLMWALSLSWVHADRPYWRVNTWVKDRGQTIFILGIICHMPQISKVSFNRPRSCMAGTSPILSCVYRGSPAVEPRVCVMPIYWYPIIIQDSRPLLLDSVCINPTAYPRWWTHELRFVVRIIPELVYQRKGMTPLESMDRLFSNYNLNHLHLH